MSPKFPGKYDIPEIKESTPTILGIPKLLQKLHPKAFRKTNTVFQTLH